MNSGLVSSLNKYNDVETKAGYAERNKTMSENLKDKLAYHKLQIAKIEETLSLVERNPDIEKLIYMLSEVH